ncbi:MAG: hypothetical protein WBV69_01290 [Candidatus Sulfotelmatobacter sp.]
MLLSYKEKEQYRDNEKSHAAARGLTNLGFASAGGSPAAGESSVNGITALHHVITAIG